MSQSSKLSISPLKSEQTFFPTISSKTSESPSKDLIPFTNSMFFEQKQDKIKGNRMKSGKQLKLERAETIYKYLHQLVLKKKDFSKAKSKIQPKDSITDSKDTISNSEDSISSIHYLQFKNYFSLQRKLMYNSANKNFKRLVNHVKILLLKVIQVIKYKTIAQLNKTRNMKIMNRIILIIIRINQISHQIYIGDFQVYIIIILMKYHYLLYKDNINQLYNNFKHNKIDKLQPDNQSNVVLDFNQQNKEYRDKNFQIIHMIKNFQQHLLKQRDEDRQKLEKDYKLFKIQRQQERIEGLYNAQVGLKDRRFKLQTKHLNKIFFSLFLLQD